MVINIRVQSYRTFKCFFRRLTQFNWVSQAPYSFKIDSSCYKKTNNVHLSTTLRYREDNEGGDGECDDVDDVEDLGDDEDNDETIVSAESEDKVYNCNTEADPSDWNKSEFEHLTEVE